MCVKQPFDDASTISHIKLAKTRKIYIEPKIENAHYEGNEIRRLGRRLEKTGHVSLQR